MNDKARRKELVAQYKRIPPEAGVYCIINTWNNKALLGSALNLAGKGHEQSQIYGETLCPWDDSTVARDALRALVTARQP